MPTKLRYLRDDEGNLGTVVVKTGPPVYVFDPFHPDDAAVQRQITESVVLAGEVEPYQPTAPFVPGVAVVQAENGELFGAAVVASTLAGFNGTGYVEFGTGPGEMAFDYESLTAGDRTFTARVQAATAGGQISLQLPDGTVVGPASIPAGGGWVDMSGVFAVQAGPNPFAIIVDHPSGTVAVDQLTITE